MGFERFIGVDYSGAETPQSRLSGLRVFEARPGEDPVEVRAGNGTSKNWSRDELAHWLRDRLQQRPRTIVGIDHAFSFPEQYFEKVSVVPGPSGGIRRAGPFSSAEDT
jgi:hypothetical protein